LEGSTSEKPVAEPLSTISGTENEPPVQVIDHKQKAFPLFCLYSFRHFFNAGIVLYYKLKHPFNFKQGIEITVEKGTSKRIRTSQVTLFYVTKCIRTSPSITALPSLASSTSPSKYYSLPLLKQLYYIALHKSIISANLHDINFAY